MDLPRIPGFQARPVSREDAADWARYACLPEVKRFTSSTASTVADVAAVIDRTLAGEAASPIHFALVPEGETALVATVGFHTVSPLNGTAEITYDVAPSHWGRGIASAACRAATRWAFDVKGWHRVQATTLLPHRRSQQVLERCGFRREGLLRAFRVVRGQPADYWLYAALPGDLDAPTAAASELPQLPDTPAGRYRHYKGGLYEVVEVARHSETLEPLVVYRPLYDRSGWWLRPHAMFFGRVLVDGEERARFERIDD